MRNKKIILSQSKRKEKIIPEPDIFFDLFTIFNCILLLSAYPIISGLLLYSEINQRAYLPEALLIFILTLLLSGFLLYAILTVNNLQRINGIAQEQNQLAIKELAEKLGSELKPCSRDWLVLILPWSIFSLHWGREIIVIFDKKDILINCTTYGMYDIKSPFHWFGNRRFESVLAAAFEKEIIQYKKSAESATIITSN